MNVLDPVPPATDVFPIALPEDPTDLRLALHRNGYRPVPVLGAHVAMKAAGKRPMMKGWETVCASADEGEIARWARAQRNCTNTGLLCGDLVGVDIDVLDVSLAERLRDMGRSMLGPTPLLRIGKAPKCLLAFRTDVPFDKVQTSEFQMLDGTVARVEVLATGQQFVAFGIHPGTKAPYHWPDRSPLDVPLSDLPVIGRDTCAAFIAVAEEALRKAGGQTSNERRDIDREGRKFAGLKPKEAPSQDLIAEAIAHIPNNDLPYDDWIKVGLALYAAFGPDGRALWEAWSAEAAKNDPAHTAQKWDSFASVRNVTVGTLFWLARQNGWRAEKPRRARTTHPSREASEDGAAEGNRPLIRIRAGMMPETIDEAEQALLGAGLGLYQRGSIVVRPAMVPVAISGGRQIDAPRLIHVRAHHMAEAFTKAERPELRAFDRDPLALVAERRGDYVTAGLTILRAFHLSGRPEQSVPLGSFTAWSGWVRDALIWLGEADPCETMEGMRGADPKLEALTAALEEWRSVIGTDRVTVREIIERAAAQQTQLFGKAEYVNPEFREALLRVAGEGGAINGTRLGKWLSQHQNRIVAGHRIIAAGTTGNRARWQLDIVNADAPDGSDPFRRAANA